MEYTVRSVPKKLLILDASYRSSKSFGCSDTLVALPTVTVGKNASGNDFVSGDKDNTDYDNLSVADAKLDSLWNAVVDTNSAKANCDVWIEYKEGTDPRGVEGVPAVEHCRAITINGIPCDIPNIQQVMRIFCEASEIDALDPDSGAYPNNLLGSQNPAGFWRVSGAIFSFSSTQESTVGSGTGTGYRRLAGVGNGRLTTLYRYPAYGVIPVLELDEDN